MARISINVEVNVPDVMQAELMRQAIQNILNELGENQSLLMQFSNPGIARDYAVRVRQLAENPLAQKLLKSFA